MLGSELYAVISSDIEVEWEDTTLNDGDFGIVAVYIIALSGAAGLDLFLATNKNLNSTIIR